MDLMRTPKYTTGVQTRVRNGTWRTTTQLQRIGIVQIGRGGFLLSAIWLLFIAIGMERGYHDSWILEGIWLPLCAVLLFYGLAISGHSEPGNVAVLTSALVFLGYSAPLLKYSYIYGTTIDTSVHFSMMRTLATTGFPEGNTYAYTPGFHLLVASMAQLSGLSVATWAKVLPGLMGSLMPLGTYLLGRRMRLSRSLLGCIVVVSGLSLPMLYLPNGTSYATLIMIPLFLLLMVRSSGAGRENRVSFTLLIVLLMAVLTVWHAISSLLIPLVMMVSGLLGLLAASLMAATLGNRQPLLRTLAVALVGMGVFGVVVTLSYWRFVATPIWSHLMNNIDIFLSALGTDDPVEGVLVPKRALTLQAAELAIVFLLYHARDVLILLLCSAGVAFNLLALGKNARFRIKHISGSVPEGHYEQVVRILIVICGVFCLIVVLTFLTQFSKHGYQRYLLYIVSVSPVIAGYGWWWSMQTVRARLTWFPTQAVFAVSAIAIYLVAGLQIYHPQGLIPAAPLPGARAGTPMYWHHQVNTEYQKQAIEFAYEELAESASLLTDYRTFQQVALFLGPDAKKEFHYGFWISPRAAYVMLHFPGPAGSYAEQAEYRSSGAIAERRNLEGVSTVYDNGGTFLMQVPQTLIEQFYLEEVPTRE